jgi:hypothetical protein
MEMILFLPAFIILDIIPAIFGYKGLSGWYCDKYGKYADDLLLVYAIVTALFVYLIYLIYK